ncbi:hypothetical protein D3C83_100870 [compost metagenome]
MNHRGRIQLFDDRRAADAVSGLEAVAIVDLCREQTVLGAEEDFSLAGLCFIDFAAGNLSR